MKIGYAMAFHHSGHIRPQGDFLLTQNLKSFYQHIDYDYGVYIADNQSEPENTVSDVITTNSFQNVNHTYIEDQYEKGISGAWNMAVNNAIVDGCDIVFLTNDDITVNSTINTLFDIIQNDPENNDTVYGPTASGISKTLLQYATAPSNTITELVNTQHRMLAGLSYVFTKEFYQKYKGKDGELFREYNVYNAGDGKWGGNESSVMVWQELGAKTKIVGHCHVIHHEHISQKSWQLARRKDHQDNGFMRDASRSVNK
jgi:hypothetical protein